MYSAVVLSDGFVYRVVGSGWGGAAFDEARAIVESFELEGKPPAR
jgi:hypothetical protein